MGDWRVRPPLAALVREACRGSGAKDSEPLLQQAATFAFLQARLVRLCPPKAASALLLHLPTLSTTMSSARQECENSPKV